MEYYNLKVSDVVKDLNSDSDKGILNSEVLERQKKYGLNELEEKKKINPLLLFLSQFKSFIIYILIFAVFISLLSGEMVEAVIILVILVFNAVFGFIQEFNAEKSIEALRKISALKSRVIRNGNVSLIDVKELVPGDIVLLEEGDKVPADCRIISETLLQTAEAALTGESKSVSKFSEPIKRKVLINDQKNMIFSGTIVAKGKAKAIVVKTGMNSQIGKIAGMISEAETGMTPLQRKLESFGKWIGLFTILICVCVFLVGVIKDGYFSLLLSGDISGFVFASREWFLTAVSLAVAAVPEGLPAIVTIALAIGVKRMVKRHSLIRKLPSVESLGETTVICSDKTGTLTKNQMTVRQVWTLDGSCEVEGIGYNPHGKINSSVSELLFRIGHLCNDSNLEKRRGVWSILGDPTEGALLVSSLKRGIDYKLEQKDWVRVSEVPFDSNRKLMSTVNENIKLKKKQIFTKGAPEAVLDVCDRVLIGGKIIKLSKKIRDDIISQNNDFAGSALRVLGFAYKDFKKNEKVEKGLIFVGLQAMLDPPQKDVAKSISKCQLAGIRVIMITGDNVHTALGVAGKIGIEGDSMTGTEFSNLSDLGKIKALRTVNVFARVEPEHKMMIVEILQKQGEVVAMTGDGVNDAPAIKKADIGIAMGINGTDVAKESSEMILLDDKFTSIVSAIEEGRGIYENIKKFVNYLLSSNLGEVLVIFFAILFGFPLPMTAVMLLWLNLVTDGLPALALSVDPNSRNLMTQPPKKSSSQIMDKVMIFNVVYVSILITAALLGIMQWGILEGFSVEKIQTIVFTGIILMELARLGAIRYEFHLGMFSNMYLVWAVLVSLSLQLVVIYSPLQVLFGTVPLGFVDWIVILGATGAVFVLNQLGMLVRNKIKWLEN